MGTFNVKLYLPHVKAVVIFLLISVLYFSPEVFQNKTVLGHDSRTGAAMSKDVSEYHKNQGELSRWTERMFGGMPTYQIAPGYESGSVVHKVKQVYSLFMTGPVSYIFIMMLGFYILLCVLGARPDLSILGAIAYAFSSYFFIIIEAGHIWKVVTLAYIPPTIAGIVLTYKGKYLLGGIITAIFLSFQIISNHIQMSYYGLFIILAYVISVFIDCYKEHKLPHFIKASTVCVIAALIAVAINGSNLFHTWQYSKETIRGKSELTHNESNKTDDGLDRDYMVQWSYGLGETWTLLIPNTKGGESGYLGNNKAIKEVQGEYQEAVAQQNQYWGDQPFTSGPVYAGAFIMTLFVMSLFLLKTRLKWGLLAALVITVMLSWGKNFMGFTDFFADYIPMYSKFRTVSSILVVAEFIIPLLAILMLKEIIENPKIIIEKKKQVYISFGLTGGFAILFALFPTLFFNFLSVQEADAYLGQVARNPALGGVIDAMESIRIGIFRSDAWRSAIFIGIGGTLLYAFAKNKLKGQLFVGLLIALCLVDMWTINKRYLNKDSFISQQQAKSTESFFPKTPADITILEDKEPNFRVFNTTVSTFNDASTSFYHNSIGGYHGAKLRRYQELIEHHLMNGNLNVLNMLNTKYFIVADQNKSIVAQQNPMASGNAWFVDSLQWVNNADEEINALKEFEPHAVAFIDKRFESEIAGKTIAKDSLSTIKLLQALPNELKYQSKSSQDGFGVFSEIYYPHGWEATIDGKPAQMVRVNYVLRGLHIPAGDHEIVMTFRPKSLAVTESIAYGGMLILVLAIGTYITILILKRRRKIA